MDFWTDDNELTIYVAAHKKVAIPIIEGYMPIEVGSYFHKKGIYPTRDNDGDNISHKNKNFCELTAYYWIWKHSSSKYVGLVHYRRFLSKKRIDDSEKYYLSQSNAVDILHKYDVILPEPIKWRDYTVAEGYDHGAGFYGDLEILRKVIDEISPEYLTEYDTVLSGHTASYCNVFVMKREFFSQYCKWLFEILFETEKRVDISGYTDAEKRIFGFMSELLLNVWVSHHHLKPYYMPLVKCKQNMRKTLKALKVIEKIPFMGFIVRYGMYLDFNRQQRIWRENHSENT